MFVKSGDVCLSPTPLLLPATRSKEGSMLSGIKGRGEWRAGKRGNNIFGSGLGNEKGKQSKSTHTLSLKNAHFPLLPFSVFTDKQQPQLHSCSMRGKGEKKMKMRTWTWELSQRPISLSFLPIDSANPLSWRLCVLCCVKGKPTHQARSQTSRSR